MAGSLQICDGAHSHLLVSLLVQVLILFGVTSVMERHRSHCYTARFHNETMWQCTHQELNEILKTVDLHILPSRNEGFPKVVLECAAAGIPSLLFSDYGAKEWMEGGFVVDKDEEMKQIINLLLQDPNRLRQASNQSTLLAEKYDWKHVVKRWEEVLSSLSP